MCLLPYQCLAVDRVGYFSLHVFRYFSVTSPLTYLAKRTTKRAMTMICLAWSVSFILWAPAILFWQYIVGERTVQPNECYIQFLSEPIITFCTAIAAFYLPVTIMATLFWKIYQETEKRVKNVEGLRGSGAGSSQSQSKGSGKAAGEDVSNSQTNSSAMVRQMSSQSCSSCELNQLAADKNNKDKVPAEIGSRGRCGAFFSRISSLVPAGRSSRRSVNTTTTTAGEAEQSSCDSLNNNEAGASGDPSGSEEEGDGVDPSKLPTGWTLTTKRACLHDIFKNDVLFPKCQMTQDVSDDRQTPVVIRGQFN